MKNKKVNKFNLSLLFIIVVVMFLVIMCLCKYISPSLSPTPAPTATMTNDEIKWEKDKKEMMKQMEKDDDKMIDDYLNVTLPNIEHTKEWGYNPEYMLVRIAENRKITFSVYKEQENILNISDKKEELLRLNKRFELSLKLWFKMKSIIVDNDDESREALVSWSKLIGETGQRQLLLNKLYDVKYEYKYNKEYEAMYSGN